MKNSNNYMASTAAAAVVITYRDSGVLDLSKDELERQRLIVDLIAVGVSGERMRRII